MLTARSHLLLDHNIQQAVDTVTYSTDHTALLQKKTRWNICRFQQPSVLLTKPGVLTCRQKAKINEMKSNYLTDCDLPEFDCTLNSELYLRGYVPLIKRFKQQDIKQYN